ncbi:MAG: 16S rRNA (guanine(1207)-N(2))-methyltransferase RsmC [Sodalis sp. (in: enterobacteria)]
MSVLTPASEVILLHQDIFLDKRVVIAGNVQDFLPAQLKAQSVKVHTAWYHHQKMLARALGEEAVQFGLVADVTLLVGCDTLIYFWPKNKPEALFQLTNLLSLLPLGCDIFVVGENRSGVRSAEPMLAAWCRLSKIDNVRHCRLYHNELIQQPYFNIEYFWKSYSFEDVLIKTLPGVFSYGRLDNGSRLLLSTFDRLIQSHVADIGCGAGVLSAVIAKRAPKVQLTLSDAYAPALAASRATLEVNGLKGEVLASDIYSTIGGCFDIIISNPPFHYGMQTNLKAAEMLIRGALTHLRIGGELRIVANAFLPYPDLLDAVFCNHKVLAKNGRFKVYQAIHQIKCNRDKGIKHH